MPARPMVTAALALAACAPRSDAPGLRLRTEHLEIRVSARPTPPVAREYVLYTITVRDRKTGEPIDGGEGQIFATSAERRGAWDSLEPGRAPGSYIARMRYVTAGDWAVAIRFRRDSTARLERVDWVQGVRTPSGPGA